MKLTLGNWALKYDLLCNVLYNINEKTLPKSLKIKIIMLKVYIKPVFDEYNNFITEAKESFKTTRYYNLFSRKNSLTFDEQLELSNLESEYNDRFNDLNQQKVIEEVDIPEITTDLYFTLDEFKEFIDINIDRIIPTSTGLLDGGDYCEQIYTEFCIIPEIKNGEV